MRTIALTTVLAVTACSSNYIPQARGRVGVIMQTGKQAYVRDGKVIEHGMLGDGLGEAVQGNPAAMAAANEYQDRIKFGLLGMLGGMVCSAGGLAYAISKAEPNESDINSKSEAGLWISLGCLVVMFVGAGYLGSAEPYRWDAINIFNDTPPPPMHIPGAPGYGYSAQKQSLKMRD
ncbi:MAG: hypothetical protein M4D80_25575 [Myxococcota bacterium]|nr:hypothetical protein [Myxococcota bacterium]